jgi:tocopherol O-methyltransferase
MGEYFNEAPNIAKFDCVWISEAMSHLPNKELFFRSAALLLNPGGKLVVADWFKSEDLTEAQFKADISPIEGQAPIFSLQSEN